jgi:putative transcriptional regulator
VGRIRGIDPVRSGSPAIVSLRLIGSLDQTKSVEAVIALRRRGAPTLKAKRAVEAAMERKANVLDVPTVESPHAFAEDLWRFGFGMSVVTPVTVDVRKLRERLGLTQEQFSLRFGLEQDAVRNWEYGRREPDAAAKSYTTVIERDPEAVQEALAVPVEWPARATQAGIPHSRLGEERCPQAGGGPRLRPGGRPTRGGR